MQRIVFQRVLGDGFFSADAVVAVMDPNVVFPPENSTNTEVILPTVVLTPPEPHTKPAPEILDWSSSTQGSDSLPP
jgi:hypothetical protein